MYKDEQLFPISCLGLYTLECTREEYKGNSTILHEQTKDPFSIINAQKR